MIYVSGQALDPMNMPYKNIPIRVEVITSTIVLPKASAVVKTDCAGQYDFMLVEGTHQIEVKYTDEYIVTGEVVVTPEMEGSTYTLNILLSL